MKKTTKKDEPFINLIFKNPFNKYIVWGSIIAACVNLLLFKYEHPFADYINGDSYKYLYTALENPDIDIYPIGYPKFLRLFSVFSHSDIALIILQYLLIQISGLALIISIFHFFTPYKITKILLSSLIALNPILLYIANYILSDALFLTLSLIWFNLLIWSIYRPNYLIIIALSLSLVFALMIRYSALYYPVITLIGLSLIKRNNLHLSIVGLSICSLLLSIFISFNRNKYAELTTTKQFNPFSGWQLANNAMYAYKFVDKHKLKKLPPKFQELDHMVRGYFDSTANNPNHPEEQLMASTIYMWSKYAPLQIYMLLKLGNIKGKEFESWAKIAPFYKAYGLEIIKSYPIEFLRFYLYPNSLNYYSPPIEFLDNYRIEIDSVKPIAQFWFEYKSNKINMKFKDSRNYILNIYPILFGILNGILLLILLCTPFLNLKKVNEKFQKLTILVISVWLLNLIFSIFASPIALRFQLFPMILVLAYLILFAEKILVKTKFSENE